VGARDLNAALATYRPRSASGGRVVRNPPPSFWTIRNLFLVIIKISIQKGRELCARTARGLTKNRERSL